MSTPTIHCQWEDERARERTDHQPSYAEAKKMKSLKLRIHGCLRASIRDCTSEVIITGIAYFSGPLGHNILFVASDLQLVILQVDHPG